MRRWHALGVALVLASPTAASAKTVRTLVSIGISNGDPTDPPLRYAGAEAERVRALFVEIGHVAPDRAHLLVDPKVEDIRWRLSRVAADLTQVQARGDDALLILYVSGHAEGGDLHVGGAHLALSELRQYVERVPARLRLLIVDACESGLVARWKGGVPAPEFEVDLTHVPLSGEVILSSSGPNEPAQEWDALGGSLFTHHLLTGLRGDADTEPDGRVTLSEAYAYAYRRTVADAQVRAQHPSVDIDLSGAGELVLTEPASARGFLLFPAPLQGKFVVASQPRTDVIAEIDKQAGAPIRIAVPPGHYLVRKTDGHEVSLDTIELPYGGEAVVAEPKMRHWPFAEARMKGAYLDLQPDSVWLEGSFTSPELVGTGPRWATEVAYQHCWGQWWAGGRLGAAPASFHTVDLSASEWDGWVAAQGGYRWVSVPWTVYLGLGAGPLLVHQHFTRDRTGVVPAVPDAWALGFALGPTAALELPLVGRWYARAELDAQEAFLPAAGQGAWSTVAGGRFGFGRRF